MSPDDEGDWIEVRRPTDPIDADMILDFLRQHNVRAAIRGNPHAIRMTWSQTSDVLRIVVAPGDVDKAREALIAMTSAGDRPFRGASPVEDARPERFEKPRSALGAACLAVLVPIGGGHFYARHGAAGTILAAGVIGAVIGVVFGGRAELAQAWAVIVVADVLGSIWAVRRFNAKRPLPEAAQRRAALAVVAVAFGVALVLG